MTVRTLCEGTLLVQVGGEGEDAHLRVKNGSTGYFRCATSDLEQAISGVPMHFSSPGESCSLSRQGDAIWVAFWTVVHSRVSCMVSVGDLRDALAEIRAAQREPRG